MEENTLPPLSPKMLVKLRQLSIVSLSHQSKKVPYTVLLSELSLSNVRELEDLIIDTMYAGILEGKLDQANGFLNVKQAMSRDVRVEDVREMIMKLHALQSRMASLNSVFSSGMETVIQSRGEEEMTRTELLKQVALLKLEGSKQTNKAKQQKTR
jgi:COP9 signalosome complex subunit 7